eukprot:Hpha_TRINITY_DN4281_c0_g1::TRINITY_DN4281_c0_g1_i2::g.186658::m.186658
MAKCGECFKMQPCSGWFEEVVEQRECDSSCGECQVEQCCELDWGRLLPTLIVPLLCCLCVGVAVLLGRCHPGRTLRRRPVAHTYGTTSRSPGHHSPPYTYGASLLWERLAEERLEGEEGGEA